MRVFIWLVLLCSCAREFKQFSTESDCTVGEVLACACDSGAAGTRTCGENFVLSACDCVTVRVTPDRATVTAEGTLQLNAVASEEGVTWSTTAGSVSDGGLFVAPAVAGVVTVSAVSVKSKARKADALITVASKPTMPEVTLMPATLERGATGVVATIDAPLPDLLYDWTVTGANVTSSTRGDHITFDVTSDSSVFISVVATNAAYERGLAALVAVQVFERLTNRDQPQIVLPASLTQGRAHLLAFVREPVAGFTYTWTVAKGGAMVSENGKNSIRIDIAEDATEL